MSEMQNLHERTGAGSDEIELRELFAILWAAKLLIFFVTTIVAAISLAFALWMTDIYRAQIVLAAADADQSSSIASQLGGAAALLGVNVGGASGDSVNTAIATLRSHQFLSRFIEENELLVPLFASKWDSRERRSVVDPSIYDESSSSWLRDEGAPTSLEAYRKFADILTVSGPDRTTGIVTVAIDWQNPEEAADWANKLVHSLNQEIRARDVREANSAILFLRQQLDNTQLVDMQRVFYQLIESQTRITMLADVREEYVFRVIDPAVVPDRKSEPRRSMIVLIGVFSGSLLALVLVLGRHFLVGTERST